MEKVTFMGIIVGICILAIVIVGMWLMLSRTTLSQQSMAGGALLYVFSAIPALFGIGLALILCAAFVFFLLKVSAMYHKSISSDTVEIIDKLGNTQLPITNINIKEHRDRNIQSLGTNNSNNLLDISKKTPKLNCRNNNIIDKTPELTEDFWD